LGASNLSDNLYFNVVLLGGVEMPAYVLAAMTIKRVGARTLCISSLLASAACCILSAYACQGPTEIADELGASADSEGSCSTTIWLGLLGKCCISLTFGVAWTYTAELLPTDCTSLGMGVCSQVLRPDALLFIQPVDPPLEYADQIRSTLIFFAAHTCPPFLAAPCTGC
jgi:hypothetical protein